MTSSLVHQYPRCKAINRCYGAARDHRCKRRGYFAGFCFQHTVNDVMHDFSPLPHHKPKHDLGGTIPLGEFNRRLQQYVADGDQRSVDYMLENFKIIDGRAVAIGHGAQTINLKEQR